jgi:hypothetical protein
MKSIRIMSIAIIMLFLASPVIAAPKLKSLCDIHYPSDSSIEWQCMKL